MSASFMTPEDKKRSDEELQAIASGRPLRDPVTGAALSRQQQSERLARNILERRSQGAYEERRTAERRERLRPQNAAEEQDSRRRAYAAYDLLDDDESTGLGGRRRASAYLTNTLGGA